MCPRAQNSWIYDAAGCTSLMNFAVATLETLNKEFDHKYFEFPKNGSKNDTKMALKLAPKWHQNGSHIKPKCLPNDLKMSWNCPQNCLKN